MHYSRGDHRTLSLLITLLLTIATFIHDNHWVRLVLIIGRCLRRCSGGGLEGIAKTNEGGVETIPFLAWDLSCISSTNSSLAIKSIEGSMLQCKIVPCNASKSIWRIIKKLNQTLFLSTGNIRCKYSELYWFLESQLVPKISHNWVKLLNTHVFLFKGSYINL